MASHANSYFSDNTDDTGAGEKSIKWGDSKDTTVNEESMREERRSEEEGGNWEDYKGKERRESDTEKSLSGDNDWEIFSKMQTPKKKDKAGVVDSGGDDDEDAFFADLMKELNDSLDESAEDELKGRVTERQTNEHEAPSDLSSLTVPKLKEVLKGKGLKVGGTKAELLERLNGN